MCRAMVCMYVCCVCVCSVEYVCCMLCTRAKHLRAPAARECGWEHWDPPLAHMLQTRRPHQGAKNMTKTSLLSSKASLGR